MLWTLDMGEWRMKSQVPGEIPSEQGVRLYFNEGIEENEEAPVFLDFESVSVIKPGKYVIDVTKLFCHWEEKF